MSNSAVTHLRSSEKSMMASCPFSNEVANCAIQAYKQHVPQFLQDSLKQTVMAAFVLCDERQSTQKISKLRTICFGVGTKFLNLECSLNESSLTVVRDLHAEVLARKALQFSLVNELEKLSINNNNNHDLTFLEQVTVQNGDSTEKMETEIHLAAKCSLHFYTSSTPCGNSAVRRWATGTSSRARESKANDTTPSEHAELDSPGSWSDVISPKNNEAKIPEILPHDPLHVVQRDAGQVALLCKHHQITPNNKNHSNENGNLSFPPNGTCLSANKNEEKIPCCSGKIAAWNFLNCWEGLLLRKMVRISNIVPSSIVVGRKFSQVHCQRALCCRVDLSTQILSKKEKNMDREFRLMKKKNANTSQVAECCDEVTGERRRQRKNGQEIDDGGLEAGKTHSQHQHQQVHHPVFLSASIKFDNSVKNVDENEGANFGESRCFWWSSPCVSEILCGKTGKKIVMAMTKQRQGDEDDGCVEEELVESLLSPHSFVNSVMAKKDGFECEDLGTFLEKIVEDDAPLQSLINHPLLFPNWPRCDLLDSFL